jgi:hypothetical protein
MAKLTDTQLTILSAAATRDDGLAITPAKMNRAAAAKVGSSLVTCKLMREARAKRGMPVWREDKDGRPVSLMITRAALTGLRKRGFAIERSLEGNATVYRIADKPVAAAA